MSRTYLASLTRISDLDRHPYEIRPEPQSTWANGDYVIGDVTGEPSVLYRVESCTGDMLPVAPGDSVVGALGHRAGTLEGVGSFRDVVDGRMHTLTSAGLLGAFTSFCIALPKPMSLTYRGHIVRGGERMTMSQFALRDTGNAYTRPTILIVGTSMSAGKSVAGRRVCEILDAAGCRTIGVKLTGAGRYRDIAGFDRAGAYAIYDFVDVGLPSTIAPEAEFRALTRRLLGHVEARAPDFVVAEAGASPLEPYNGDAAIQELGDTVACTILCASDPYAVIGVRDAFGLKPDLVAGPAAQTSAAVELVHKLAAVPAINVIDPSTTGEFRAFLESRLGVDLTPGPAPRYASGKHHQSLMPGPQQGS